MLVGLICLVAAVSAVVWSAADNGRQGASTRLKATILIVSLLLLILLITSLQVDLSITPISSGS